MRAVVVEAVEPCLQHHGRAGESEHQQRVDQDRQHRELHLAGLDLLAEIFGRAAHHQAGHEHRDHGDDQDAVEPRADAARRDAAHQHVEHRHEPAERRQAVVHGDDRARAGAGRAGAEQRRQGLAEAQLLAFEIAGRAVDPERGQDRVAEGLRAVDHRDADDQDDAHGGQQRAPLLPVADQATEGDDRGHRDEQQAEGLEHHDPGARALRRDAPNWR